MPQAPPLTNELARRIEQTMFRHVAQTDGVDSNSTARQIARFGQTIAVKTKSGRPNNSVFCFCGEDLPHLDAILAFYAADNLEPRFYLAPMGFTRDVAAALTAAGFGQRDFEQAVLYGLPAPTPPPLPNGLTIERVTHENLEESIRTTADGLEWPTTWGDAAMRGLREEFAPESLWYLARFDGQAAGVASLRRTDGCAMLMDGAVIPKFRRRGCHLAMVHHRLHVAHELGDALIIGCAAFGSTSFQNQQRAGLRLAYIESAWKRNKPSA